MTGRASQIETEGPDISQSTVEKLSASTKRRLDFLNDQNCYVYDGKAKNIMENKAILRAPLASPLFY